MIRTKKYFSAAICLICILLAGCADNSVKTETDEADTLSLYCMSNDARVDLYIATFKSFYQNVEVTKRTFNDITQMDEQVKNELSAGKGPDIIIFPEKTGLDVLQMAGNGAFKDLGDEMKQDGGLNQDEYLPGTFTAGKVDDKVFLLPLTFTVPTVIYDCKADLGFSPELVITYEQLLGSLKAAEEQFREEEDFGTVIYADPMGQLLATSQAYSLLPAVEAVTYNDTALKEAVEIICLMARQSEQITNILSAHGSFYVDYASHFAYWYDSLPDLTFILWMTEGAYSRDGSEMGVSMFGQTDSSQVMANVSSYGGVTKNAGPYAYEFLRTAMDCNPFSSLDTVYGMSLNKKNIENQITTFQSRHDEILSKGERFELEGLSDDKAELLRQIYGSISDLQIYNNGVAEIILDSIIPYHKGEKSYEECEKDFKQKINLYIAE